MGLAKHRGFAKIAARRSPDGRKADLTVLKAPRVVQMLKERRGRGGTRMHAGHAELRGSAGSMMKEYGERSARMGRGRTPRT